MCGRYALFAPPKQLKDLFGTENILDFPPRYNITPQQHLPVVIRHRTGLARWGIDTAGGGPAARPAINARSETVHDKPSFAGSWVRGRRCLVPANGYYEWLRGQGAPARPFYIAPAHGGILALAGIWAMAGDVVCFAILTRPAGADIAAIHPRAPVMLAPEHAGAWFAATPGQALIMLRDSAPPTLAVHEVDCRVGKVAADDALLISPLKTPRPAASGI